MRYVVLWRKKPPQLPGADLLTLELRSVRNSISFCVGGKNADWWRNNIKQGGLCRAITSCVLALLHLPMDAEPIVLAAPISSNTEFSIGGNLFISQADPPLVRRRWWQRKLSLPIITVVVALPGA